MKKTISKAISMMSLLTLFSGSLASGANTPIGEGGMSECIRLSFNVALEEYSKSHALHSIPKIDISQSDSSPSNGIDFMVSFNGSVIYYVIATPNVETNTQGIPINLKGCTGARIHSGTESSVSMQ